MGACSKPETALAYRFEPSSAQSYIWNVTSTTQIESPNQEATSTTRLEVKVTERIEASTVRNHVTLTLLLAPRRIIFDGAEGTPPPTTTTTLELDRTGRVVKVLRDSDLDPGIDLDQLAAEMRPMLGSAPVAIGDTWKAPIKIKTPTSSLDVKGKGRLEGFGFAGRSRLARITIDRKGNATSEQRIGRARVLLKGKITEHLSAKIDIDRGQVITVTSRTSSLFDLSLAGSGLAGRLSVVVHARLIAS